MSKCIGCGITIQHEDPKKLGYVPVSITVEKGDNLYCKRCFELMHYNKETYQDHFQIFNENFYQKISAIKDKPSMILLIIDVLDLYGGFIPHLKKYVNESPVIILLNKIDLLPKSIKIGQLINRTKALAKEEELNVKQVFPISAISSKNIEHVMKQVLSQLYKKHSKIQDLYVLGCTSVGKSTFINALLKKYGNDTNLLTTSERYQTTLDLIKIPLGEDVNRNNHFLFDTPGFVSPGNIGTYLSYEAMRKLLPKQYIKAKTYQLQSLQTIFLAGLIRVDFEEGVGISTSTFVANELYVHRTKLNQAQTFYEKHLGELLTPPMLDSEIAFVKKLKEESFSFSGIYDLAISGLGFLHLKGEKVKLKVYSPEPVLVKLVPSFIVEESK